MWALSLPCCGMQLMHTSHRPDCHSKVEGTTACAGHSILAWQCHSKVEDMTFVQGTPFLHGIADIAHFCWLASWRRRGSPGYLLRRGCSSQKADPDRHLNADTHALRHIKCTITAHLESLHGSVSSSPHTWKLTVCPRHHGSVSVILKGSEVSNFVLLYRASAGNSVHTDSMTAVEPASRCLGYQVCTYVLQATGRAEQQARPPLQHPPGTVEARKSRC